MASVPAYRLLSPAHLWERVRTAEAMLRECSLCPRRCRVDRRKGEIGFCKAGDRPLVASWGPHFGEEAPLVGSHGSGTVFFSRCNLGCVFCQNWSISHSGEGREMSCERLAEVFLELQGLGCHNVNLVSPTHQMPMILRSLALAAERGLNIPVVYNCGGYESLEALRMLDGIIDIYMPDFKYALPETARMLSKGEDYPQVVKAAVIEMHRQVGDLLIDERGIALRGLLIRHLVLPEGRAGTAEVVRFIAEEISKDTYINIMDQYYPCYHADEYPPLDRRVTRKEYDEAIRLAQAAGLRRIDGISA